MVTIRSERILDIWVMSCLRIRLVSLLLFLPLFTAFGQAPKSKNARDYFELGETALQSKNFRTALAHFNEAIRIEPFLWDAYYLRGIARDRLGDAKGAVTDFNIFLEANPTNAEVLFSRAVIRYQIGQWAMAHEDFFKLLKLPSGETNTLFFQVDKGGMANRVFTAQGDVRATYFNYLGMIALKQNHYQQSLSFLDSALQISPTCADCYVNRGLTSQYLRDTTQAIRDFRKALELDPGNSFAEHNLAVLSGFGGNLMTTEKTLTSAIEKNPHLPYSYSERGQVRSKMQNWKGALADFDEALRIDPTDVDDWLGRGLAKDHLKDWTGAFNDFTKAISIKEDFEKAWLCRGNVLIKLNRLSEAIEDYSLAIHYFPDYGSAYYNRALTYHNLGKTKLACADLQMAQRLNTKIDPKAFSRICK